MPAIKKLCNHVEQAVPGVVVERDSRLTLILMLVQHHQVAAGQGVEHLVHNIVFSVMQGVERTPRDLLVFREDGEVVEELLQLLSIPLHTPRTCFPISLLEVDKAHLQGRKYSCAVVITL